MARKYQFRKLPPSLDSFGIAIDFLSRVAPFSTAQVGPFTRAVRRQILRGEHVIGWDGEELVAYAGWLPTFEAAAKAWQEGGGDLKPADQGADAVALTTVAASRDDATLGLMRAARDLNPGLRVFFKRSYSDEGRPARKSAVLNRSAGARSTAAPSVAPSPGAARPAIADDPCGFLFGLAERAPGRTERVAVGEESVLIVQDPKVATHVLVGNGANYLKNFASFTPLFGRSRLTLDGEAWRHSQRVSQPFIAPHDVGRAEAILSRQYSALTESLLREASGSALAVDGMIDRAAIGSLLALAFSTEIDDLGAGLQPDLRLVIRFCARRAWDLAGVPFAVTPSDIDAARVAAARIREAIGGLIERRRRAGERPNDALDALLEAAVRADAPTDDPLDLVGEIVTLIVAGSDTTAAAIGWALSILASHAEFQEQLRSEIRAVTGARPATLEDAGKAPSLRPFLDETLRMFPPVAILSRFAQAKDEVGGHAVEAGDRVLVSVIGLHQNPTAWDSPREFRLDRHSGEPRANRRSVFMPFSGGPRICGGARFAQMEMSLAVMLVLQRCRLELPEPLPLAFEWGASLRRLGGQKIRVTAV